MSQPPAFFSVLYMSTLRVLGERGVSTIFFFLALVGPLRISPAVAAMQQMQPANDCYSIGLSCVINCFISVQDWGGPEACQLCMDECYGLRQRCEEGEVTHIDVNDNDPGDADRLFDINPAFFPGCFPWAH